MRRRPSPEAGPPLSSEPVSFSQRLHDEAAPIWTAIFTHPFLRALVDGTLPIESFRYFLAQDYRYLEAFGRAVALALAKAPDTTALHRLVARVTTPIERPLHAHLLDLAGLSADEVEALEPAPANLAYMNHLLATAALGDAGVAAAALLPCPWTYHLIGERMAEWGTPREPLYAEWASFYASGMLAESTRAWRELVDEAAATASEAECRAMRRAFLRSSRYEYLFWDAAYRREGWPV
ncbi:MAG TPA: thiaminase II [Dehalococcoidia bacterium]|jgi:thiaminase/transcriptional activator TenA|nr:thiaminase II [Dehalococcoidia bacterium]